MTAADAVQEAIMSRYGLFPRDGWRESITRTAADLGRLTHFPPNTLLRNAITDSGLLEEFAGRMTVPESYFFRHPEQLVHAASTIQTVLQDNPGITVQVWSAGCSTGEEPLSLAILLKEQLPPASLERVVITANDLNAQSIASAKQGVFSAWSFRGLSELRQNAYFSRISERRYQISEPLLKRVTFAHRSIQEQLLRFSNNSIDVILFRNVGIYLTDASVQSIYAGFSNVLKWNGHLFTAPSDPPNRHPALHQIPAAFQIVYRKTEAQPCDTTRTAPPSMRHREAPQLRRISPSSAPQKSPEKKGGRQSCLDAGQAALHAMDPATAAMHFQNAMVENPDDPEARFWFAVALLEAGAPNRSRAQLNALLTSLQAVPPDTRLSDGLATIRELETNVRSLLKILDENTGD